MKHFANKLWNIARFVMANIESSDYKWEAITDADRDILAKLDAVVKSSTEHLEKFRLHEAAREIYQFVWHEFADIYIEASKKQLADETLKNNTYKLLTYNLQAVLKLLHPFMPFVTEEIWSYLGSDGLGRDGSYLSQKELLMISEWPEKKTS